MTRDEELQTRILGLIRTQVEAIIADRDLRQAQCDTLTAENETLRMQVVACGTAAFQNTESSKAERIGRDSPYWSQMYDDVCTAVDREIALRAENEALRANKLTMLDIAETLMAQNEALQLQLGAGSDYASQLSEALSALRKERDGLKEAELRYFGASSSEREQTNE